MDTDISQGIKIAVISDLHVMAPELLVKEGPAFEEYLNRDRKMLRESLAILETLVDGILNEKPRPILTLVTGDLTKDGEQASHKLVASQLERLTAAGIQVLVIPGNHDINNPDAKVFEGESVSPTETITRQEFAAIYRNMGYDDLSRRDPDSLSYCRDIGDRLTIMAIDACMDRLNTFVSRGEARDHCKTSGRLETSTQQWLVDEATRAASAGRHVIAMMHHHLVSHFHMEDRLASPYMVDDAGQLCQRLIESGVHVIFTGHLHISDISQTTFRHGNMVEIATAAAVGYPCQWRIATCFPNTGKLQLRTISLHSLPGDDDFAYRSRKAFSNCIPSMTHGVLVRYWPEITQTLDTYRREHPFLMRYINLPETPDAIANLLLKNLQEPVTRAYIAFAEGNEGGFDHRQLVEQLITGVDHVVNETVKGILRPIAKLAFRWRIYKTARLVLRSILEDRNDIGTSHETVINDHTAIIDL